eukprot:721988-Amphidinium_carterae.1
MRISKPALKTGRHDGMVPTNKIGATHDAAIEVHLLVAPVAVHTARVPRFGRGQRGASRQNCSSPVMHCSRQR